MLFFPDRRTCTSPACFSRANCVEIRLCFMLRISCNSATDNSSASSNSRRRRRVTSLSSFKDSKKADMPTMMNHLPPIASGLSRCRGGLALSGNWG